MLVRAIHLAAETGEIEIIDLGEDRLKTMYDTLGCRLVECVRLPDGIDMWMDEEGTFREDNHPNHVAQIYARHVSKLAWPLFRGDAIFATTDGEGETVGLDDDQVARIVDRLEQIRGMVSLFLATQD